MFDAGVGAVVVTGDDGAELGVLHLEQIRELLA
jgi:hypothetical protein